MNAETVVAALQSRDSRRAGDEMTFLCPSHDDHRPSARFNCAKRVWRCDSCGAGGGWQSLALALGVADDDDASGITLGDLALAKMLPASLLQSFGVTERRLYGRVCLDIPWRDAAGVTRAVHRRLALSGSRRFAWRKGDKLHEPYGLDCLKLARARGYIVLVEGETDVWTLAHAGVPALGVPGAAVFKDHWTTHLEGLEVYVWREPDTGGDALLRRCRALLPNARLIDSSPAKDANDLWQSVGGDAEAFLVRLGELQVGAVCVSVAEDVERSRETEEAWRLASPLFGSGTLTESIRDAIRRGGYVGDLLPPLVAYIALTSRLLERPLNVAFVAPSAAGKNASVDAALALFPASAYFEVKAGSARALIYADVDLAHRVIVMAEADSIPQEDGSAASAMRALVTDNELKYLVVEKDNSGSRRTREIVRQGPTGLITTSTRSVDGQLGTRMLEVAVADTPEQTRAVMVAHAGLVNGRRLGANVEGLVAVQRWLELGGKRRVVVPYADALARLVSSSQVRMRRDFRQLLTAIQAVALLNQCLRPRTDDGAIIAQVRDYEIVREIFEPLLATAAAGGVSRAVRDTVAAVSLRLVERPEGVHVADVARELGIDKATALRRVRRATGLGVLINKETRRGNPASLVLGDALPDDEPALPPATLLTGIAPDLDATVQPLVDDDAAHMEAADHQSEGRVARLHDISVVEVEVDADPTGATLVALGAGGTSGVGCADGRLP